MQARTGVFRGRDETIFRREARALRGLFPADEDVRGVVAVNGDAGLQYPDAEESAERRVGLHLQQSAGDDPTSANFFRPRSPGLIATTVPDWPTGSSAREHSAGSRVRVA